MLESSRSPEYRFLSLPAVEIHAIKRRQSDGVVYMHPESRILNGFSTRGVKGAIVGFAGCLNSQLVLDEN